MNLFYAVVITLLVITNIGLIIAFVLADIDSKKTIRKNNEEERKAKVTKAIKLLGEEEQL